MCSRSSCYSCSKVDQCGWCATSSAVAVGDCVPASEASTCPSFVTESSACPSVGEDVILKNITGMLGAMIGVAILLNVYNRVSNRRRRRKLQHSIFELPVYVYSSSTRKRAKAARQARLRVQSEGASSSDPTQDAEDGGSAPAALASSSTSSGSSSSSEDEDEASAVTCTVCLAAYEEEDVIKVLPCGHEFHSGCLDSWLEQKATCPLCMAPAFPKVRDQDRASHGQASIQGLRQAEATPPPLASSDGAQGSQRGSACSGHGFDGGLLLARPASPPPPETNGEAGVDGSLPLSEARPRDALEAAPREEAVAMAVVAEEGEMGAKKDGPPVSEEATATATSAEDIRPLTSGAASAPPPVGSAVIASDANIHVEAGEGGASSGTGESVAGGGRGEGAAGVTHPSGDASPHHGGGGIATEAAKPRNVTPERAGREVSLSELEKGQAEPANAAVDAGVVAVDAAGVDGVDIEGGRISGVDGNMGEDAVANQA